MEFKNYIFSLQPKFKITFKATIKTRFKTTFDKFHQKEIRWAVNKYFKRCI